jgi:competence protein ComEA
MPQSLLPAEKTSSPTLHAPININTASAQDMEALPGVGPAIAERIVQHRLQHGRFKSLADLDSVSGIGPKKLEKLRTAVTF